MAPVALAALHVSPLAATFLAFLAIGATNIPLVAAQVCTDATALEVHMDVAAADAIIANAWNSSHTCPPESFWWKHHKDVHGGYEGCVSEIGLIPCGTNGFTGMQQMQGGVDVKLAVKWNPSTMSCIKSGFTVQDEMLYIRGGLPHDGPELKKRTGMNPVVTFPLLRSPYPRHLNSEDHTDDDEDMKATLKEFMMYQKAFTKDQLDTYDVLGTEGAEQGMVTIHAGKALDIARTSCNRAIYVLVEAPSYGYTTRRIEELVNSEKDKFLSHHMWNDGTAMQNITCPTDDVTVTMVGWFPNTAYPIRVGEYSLREGSEQKAQNKSAIELKFAASQSMPLILVCPVWGTYLYERASVHQLFIWHQASPFLLLPLCRAPTSRRQHLDTTAMSSLSLKMLPHLGSSLWCSLRTPAARSRRRTFQPGRVASCATAATCTPPTLAVATPRARRTAPQPTTTAAT